MLLSNFFARLTFENKCNTNEIIKYIIITDRKNLKLFKIGALTNKKDEQNRIDETSFDFKLINNLKYNKK